jgi:diadenosine tetraphosphate (Ap4A) HIT family hydrolase
MDRNANLTILENEHAVLAHADFCSVPGYLVLRMRKDVESFGDLSTPGAQRLGGLLASAAAAIETVTKADRVYCLSFCEVDRRLHFHLFPRTDELLAEYQEATGTAGQAVDGPALFTWARANFPADRTPPAGWPKVGDVCAALRDILAPGLAPREF